MFIVHVHIQVKPGMIEAFREASLENAKNSLTEPGVARFDFVQLMDDPTNFILVEVYKTQEAAAYHKETSHYLKWRDTVADMMAKPRIGIKYKNIFPDEDGWES
jgi:quinol monooxygenase YgiN